MTKIAADGGSTRTGLGTWAWVSLIAIFATSLYTDVSRLRNPSGEKYIVNYYEGGQADFTYPYLGARALLARVHPYRTADPAFKHPVFGAETIGGVPFVQIYPPGHFLTYLPLALVFGADGVAAGRVFFHLSLLFLMLLGVLVHRLVRAARGQPLSPLFALVVVTALLTQPGVQLGLERGQSDILIALLSWAAVYFAARGRMGAALFAIVWAASIKPYPSLLAAGLGVIAVGSQARRRALIGVLAGAGLFVLPVVHYLADGARGTMWRMNLSGTEWYTNGFNSAVAHTISARAAEPGRVVLAAIALSVTLLWGWRAWQRRHETRGSDGAAAFALAMFATAALGTMVGLSKASIAYNLIIVLPGAVVLAASHDHVAAMMDLGRAGRHVLGASVTLCAVALFLCRWKETVPVAALGLVALLVLLGVLAVLMPSPTALTAPRPTTTAPAYDEPDSSARERAGDDRARLVEDRG